MIVVYIAGPFRSRSKPYNYFEQHENIIKAERAAWNVWAMGAAAICPHLNTIHFQGSLPDDTWLKGDLEIMKRCDAVYLIPGWETSTGSQEERRVALELGIPVFDHFIGLERFIIGNRNDR